MNLLFGAITIVEQFDCNPFVTLPAKASRAESAWEKCRSPNKSAVRI